MIGNPQITSKREQQTFWSLFRRARPCDSVKGLEMIWMGAFLLYLWLGNTYGGGERAAHGPPAWSHSHCLGEIPGQDQQFDASSSSKPKQQQITQVLLQAFPPSTQAETGYIKYSSSFLPFFCCPVSLHAVQVSPASVPSFLLQTDFNQTPDLKAPKQPTKNVFQHAKFEKPQ